MSFQENLKYYREKAGYKTAKELADILNLPYNTYAGYESKGREPKYQMLCKIADLLNVSTDELLGRENNILGKNEDERLKRLINYLLSSTDKEISIELNNIEKEDIEFFLTYKNIHLLVNTSKKSIIDNINVVNKITENTKRKIFQEVLKNTFSKVNNLLLAIDENNANNKLSTLKAFFELQKILLSGKYIQDYDDNKELFSEINFKQIALYKDKEDK